MSFWSRLIPNIFFGVALGCAALVAHADIYKWVDQAGVVHYSDTKPRDETIEVSEFSVSPIHIDDKGVVVQAPAKPAAEVKTAPAPLAKPTFSLSSVWVAVKKYWYHWRGTDTANAAPASGTAPETRPSGTLPPDTVVISNENMGTVLEQIERDKQQQQEKEEARARQSVEIFTAPWCGYCKKAIVYLELNKIAYEEYDVTQNSAAALRQKMLGGSGGVPFAVINGQNISGWNQQAYARALGLAK